MDLKRNSQLEEILDALRDLIYELIPEDYFEHVAFNGAARFYVNDVTIYTKPLKNKQDAAKLVLQVPKRNKKHSLKEYSTVHWHFNSIDDVVNNASFVSKELRKSLKY